MPLPDLLGSLEREAAVELAAIRDDACACCDALRAEAAARRGAASREAAAVYRTEVQARAEAELAAVTRRTRATVLEARARMLARVRAALEASLPRVVERVRDELRDAVRALGAEPRDVATGVIGELGAVTIDATLAAALDRWWPRLAMEAVT